MLEERRVASPKTGRLGKCCAAFGLNKPSNRLQGVGVTGTLLIATIAGIYTYLEGRRANERLRHERLLGIRAELTDLHQEVYYNKIMADGFFNIASAVADTLEDGGDDVTATRVRTDATLGYLRFIQANETLIEQGVALVDELSKLNESKVLAGDLLAISVGMYNSGQMKSAREYAERGLSKAANTNLRLQLQGQLARIEYALGRPERGRRHFRTALQSIEQSDDYVESVERDAATALMGVIQAGYEVLAVGNGGKPNLGSTLMVASLDLVDGMPDLEVPRIVKHLAKALETQLSNPPSDHLRDPMYWAMVNHELRLRGYRLPNVTTLEQLTNLDGYRKKAQDLLDANSLNHSPGFSSFSAEEPSPQNSTSSGEAAPTAPKASSATD